MLNRFVCFLVSLLLATPAFAITYFVDSRKGDDRNAGTLKSHPWQTLKKVNETQLNPGDHVLLRGGSAWTAQLKPSSSGADGRPIIIDRYGKGPEPKIDAAGKWEDAVLLYNVQQIEIRNLEVTNHGSSPAERRGVHLFLDNFGVGRHIVISGLYIHDVNGLNGHGNDHKDNGGIIFRTVGDRVPSRFDDLRIERNIILHVDRSAIAAHSYHAMRTHWNPSLNVILRDNYVDDAGGDGIVPWATDHALIEHNIVKNCNRRAGSYNAGIWPWSTDDSIFRLNEASFTRTTMDGQGFDSDYNSRGTIFEYNYSHDNEGGFMLICTPGKRDPQENVGNVGTIVRNNISRNDKSRAFTISAVEQTLIAENVIYVPAGTDFHMVEFVDWQGWAEHTSFKNNRFYVKGISRYGYQVNRHQDGRYEIAPGWGPAKDVTFAGNIYTGTHIDPPSDYRASEASTPSQANWKEPEFNESRPKRYDKFLQEHRRWMVALMQAHFGSFQSNIPAKEISSRSSY
jgi:hypothetical protein